MYNKKRQCCSDFASFYVGKIVILLSGGTIILGVQKRELAAKYYNSFAVAGSTLIWLLVAETLFAAMILLLLAEFYSMVN